MLGLLGFFSYQRSLVSTPSELTFQLDEDVPGEFVGGFLLQPTNPRHTLLARVYCGSSIVHESRHISRAVWDLHHWKWELRSGVGLGVNDVVFEQQIPATVPSGGRNYEDFYATYLGTYFPPVAQANRPSPGLGSPLTPPIPAQNTPRTPTYVYSAKHMPTWFTTERDVGEILKITVKSYIEQPSSGGQLNDDPPTGGSDAEPDEIEQPFAGVIRGWIMRI
jgi:hypothetical protein